MNIEQFYPIFLEANNVVIDSRKIEKDDLFFAFSGENFNAATSAASAIENGAKAVIVEDKNFENPNNNIFYTSSTLEFLQQLAKWHRNQINIPIIALTGSNGKTTTKELIHAVLSQKYKVQYTYGNLNNHIGVPLTILSIKPEHEMAVIEMGANHQKEIELLCDIAKPDFGYITNFGKAHLEGFGGFEGVIKGKTELYHFLEKNNKTILVNNLDEIQKEKTEHYLNKITFGTKESDYYFQQFSNHNFVGISYNGENAQSNLTGDYNFNNISAAASFGLYFNVNFNLIKNAIEHYTPTNMRSQVIVQNGKTLVLDAYNANPSSMAVALQNFKDFTGTKTIIIGDMLELGSESKTEHIQILELAKSLNFDEIITVGKNFAEVNPELSFLNVTELIEFLQKNPVKSNNVLLKASRGIAIEKAAEFL